MASNSTDLFASSIVDRKRQIRAQFSTNLGRLLDEKHIKQSQLAAGVNEIFAANNVRSDANDPKSPLRTVPAWELSRWARGQITPDPVAIDAIAKVLGVQSDELVHGITADADPNAVVSSYKQIGNKFFWEMKGTVSAATHRALMRVLADETVHSAMAAFVTCESCGQSVDAGNVDIVNRADGTVGTTCKPCNGRLK